MRGGEDTAFESDVRLLRARGHEVHTLVYENKALRQKSIFWRLSHTFGNRQIAVDLQKSMQHFAPDLLHVHNWAYYVTPSVFSAAHRLKLPIVARMGGNYRLLCINAKLRRNNRLCTLCVGKKVPLYGVIHRCFQHSWTKSSLLQAIMSYHHLKGTFSAIDRFLVFSAFTRQLFSASLRIPQEKFFVLRHGRADPLDFLPSLQQRKGFFLYVGRMSAEKGLDLLMEIAQRHPFPILFIGEGPKEEKVRAFCEKYPKQATLLPQQPKKTVLQWMRQATALLVPSQWYEGLPNVIVEAFSCATPVLVSKNENLQQFVSPKEGFCLPPTQPMAWVAAIRKLQEDKKLWKSLSIAARKRYEAHHTLKEYYAALMEVYAQAISHRKALKDRALPQKKDAETPQGK